MDAFSRLLHYTQTGVRAPRHSGSRSWFRTTGFLRMYNGITMIRYALAIALAASTAFAVESFPTSAGTLQLTPIQHASLMIQAGGKTLYIDPAEGGYDSLPKADYILITDI